MKKIAIFAIFLMATIMTFGQLVPDEQYLPTCSVKSVTTHFTRFIPSGTTVKVGTSQYVLLADGGVGNSLSKMLLLGTAEVDPCCGSTGTVSATSTTTTINNDSVIIGNGTGAIGIFPGTLTVRKLATLAGGASIAGHLFSRYDANGLKIGSSFHAGDTLFGNVLFGRSMRLGYGGGTDSSNIIITPYNVNLPTSGGSYINNILLGATGTYMTSARNNFFAGQYAGSSATTASQDVGIGIGALQSITTQSSSVGVGIYAGATHPGSSCIYLGNWAGQKSIGNNLLIINNNYGGQDTAIIYGVMNGTPASNIMQLNAVTQIQKIKLPVTDTTTKISGFVNVGGHIFVGNGTYFKLLY
jgi:hypothetical protein